MPRILLDALTYFIAVFCVSYTTLDLIARIAR